MYMYTLYIRFMIKSQPMNGQFVNIFMYINARADTGRAIGDIPPLNGSGGDCNFVPP